VYANGGHNHPIVHQAAQGSSIEITTRGAILGLFDSIPCEEAELVLERGDRAVFYTDGVNEAMNERGDQFETQSLIDSVNRSAGKSAQETLDAILADVDAFVGETPPHDDLTIFVVRRTG
jgi:sigma-B regulation protein RsbU (phosphoserine phosphatase)